MLNLSQLGRESLDYSLIRKVRNIRNPDIYLAENLADYRENASSLEFPWYKRLPSIDKFMDRAYIIFQNIGFKKLVHEKREIPNWFILHDYSGQELVYWNANHDLFPAIASFDEVRAKQGLKEDDWVYEVFVRYLIKSNLPNVIEVNRYKFSNRKPEEDSLFKKIERFFPEFEPEWRPAF